MIPSLNWLSALAGAIPVAIIAWLLHSVDVNHINAKHEAALIAQRVEDQKQCDMDKNLTKEANDALQKDRDTIAARLNSLLMQHPAGCVMPVPHSSQLPSSGKGKHAGQNGGRAGVSTDWLREFAAECEGYRTEVEACTKFVTDTYNAKTKH